MSLLPSPYGQTPSASTASLIGPSLQYLTDSPTTTKLVDASLQDYLLTEAAQTLKESSAVARNRLKQREEEMIKNGLLPASSASASGSAGGSAHQGKNTTSFGVTVKAAPLSEEEEALRVRLEAMGAQVGANLAERLVGERQRFADTLDIIKFLCKDVWSAVWDKQIDNLRTNHRGVYVLQDNAFRPILRISTYEGPADALKRARIYTAFPAGLIRGTLSRVGIQATVVAEITSLPQCTFQIKLPKGT
ncbi:hypothetical protein M422DRAFT_75206 [Sphaerobolus stellatus SS14]|uniref:Trafficking protein particle complex subunit n=1 Tax=Sphaerobolus stellatus (strain SS14) TaxID=990650 RepID=A0A0C9VRW9_SPHS4|nr:hypothetical protein M422DRAFT_75206 [Sphaerobolus stellatus SS14]